MDLSASTYLMIPATFIFICTLYIKKNNILEKIFHIINITLICICLIIGIFDLGLYSAWGTKINGKALSYLLFPKEAITSFAGVHYLVLSVILVSELFVFIVIYKKIIKLTHSKLSNIFLKITGCVFLLLLLFTTIRGGWQKYPLSKNAVYYSPYPVLNYSALNGFWNFMDLMVTPAIKKNPYNYFPIEQAKKIVNGMNQTKSDSTPSILTTNRPNIVLIMLESVSAECIKRLNGLSGVMPKLDSISKHGLLFMNFYANGFRTEQGIISLLSSFPAQPQTTIMRNFGKFEKLPNLAKTLGKYGYSDNYYYSGNLVFANQIAFIRLSGFTHILDEENYTWNKRSDWGAYDEELFACHLKEAEKDPSPFFSIIMTSTNHEPFNAKVEKIFLGTQETDDYKNTVYYTDKCLEEYLRIAKEKPWYKNTLFIITADHAHKYPKNRKAYEAERHRIPLLFFGNVIKTEYRGKIIDKIGSQIDLPAMLLAQLQIPYNTFTKSKNLLNPGSPAFAFYTFDNGFGIISDKQTIIFDHNQKKVIFRKNNSTSVIDNELTDQGKAYLQVMMQEYIDFNN